MKSLVNDFIETLRIIEVFSERPKTIEELESELKVYNRNLYRTIKSLRQNGFEIIKSTGERIPTYQMTEVSNEVKSIIQNIHDKIHRLNA